MRLGEILKRAWNGVKSPGSWGFLGTFYGMTIVIGIVLAVAFVMIVGVGSLSTVGRALSATRPDFSAVSSSFVIAIIVISVAAILLYAPIVIAFNAGLVHLSNEVAQGRRARVGDGWKAGLHHWARVFVVDFATGLVGFVLFSIAIGLLTILVVGTFGSTDFNNTSALAGLSVGICCGGAFFYLLWIAVAMLLQAWEGLSVRHVVVGEMTGGAALGAGFRMLGSEFKRVVLLALALFGITLAVSVAVQMVITPFNLLSSSGSDAAALAGSSISFVIAIANMVISAGITLFSYSAWTAFYRDASGIDPVPAAQAPGSYPPPGVPAYAPPAPPVPPASPAAPMASETPEAAEPPIVDVDVPTVGEPPTEETPPADA